MKVFLKKGQTQAMSFNGAIRTGLFLESQTFLVDGYKQFQRDFIDNLATVAPGIWGASNLAYYSNSEEMIADTSRGEPIIPTYFVSRILKDSFLLEILEKYNVHPSVDATLQRKETMPSDDEQSFEPEPTPATFLISSIEIRLNDFGYGTVIFVGAIRANKDIDVIEFKKITEDIAPRLNNYHDIFKSTFETVWNNIPKNILSDAAFVGNLRTRDHKKYYMGRNKPVGYMLNAMRIITVACASDEELQQAKKDYIPLLFSQSKDDIYDCSINPNLSIYIGHGNYIIIYNEREVSNWDRSLLQRTMRIKNVFYSMFEEITENLIHLNNSINLDGTESKPKDLEIKARILVEYKARSEFFRAVYDDYDNHLGPQSLRIWRKAEDIWETEDRIYALKNQLDLTEHIHNRLMSDLNYIHNKKMSTFVSVFAVLGSIAIILNFIDFTQSSDTLVAPDNLRVIILGMMILIISIFTLRIFKSSEKHP